MLNEKQRAVLTEFEIQWMDHNDPDDFGEWSINNLIASLAAARLQRNAAIEAAELFRARLCGHISALSQVWPKEIDALLAEAKGTTGANDGLPNSQRS